MCACAEQPTLGALLLPPPAASPAPELGALAAVLHGKLVLLSSAGSSRLDTAASLDLLGLTAQQGFTERMKTEAAALLEGLEAWVGRQAMSLELAGHLDKLAQSFDSLLRVLDGLYQVRAHACMPACMGACMCLGRCMQRAAVPCRDAASPPCVCVRLDQDQEGGQRPAD